MAALSSVSILLLLANIHLNIHPSDAFTLRPQTQTQRPAQSHDQLWRRLKYSTTSNGTGSGAGAGAGASISGKGSMIDVASTRRRISLMASDSSSSENNDNESTSNPNNSNNSNNNSQTKPKSLAEMEDAVEQTLESNQPLDLASSYSSASQNALSSKSSTSSLQHNMRAPTTSSSSSKTFYTQEQSFDDEDREAMMRMEYINDYLKKDDEVYKREKLEKILGKYSKYVLQDGESDGENDNNGGGDTDSGTDGGNNGTLNSSDSSSGESTKNKKGATTNKKGKGENKTKTKGISIEDGWKKIMEEERKRIENDNKLKTQVAKSAGVTLDVLEREVPLSDPSTSDDNSSDSSDASAPGSSIKPMKVKGKAAPSWFDDEDYNLQLRSSNNNNNNDDDNSGDDGHSENNKNNSKNNMSDVNEDNPTIINGKLVLNESELTNGIRVGSAGGWSLEVFPGDFVVHRKYGIGRYDQTIIKPKKKLTVQEREAQARRRDDIVRELMSTRVEKNLDAGDIEAVVKKFGSEDDKDPISNPMQTVLEVTYSDAKVHIPVDKAYRLSRYRAGDAVVKPRLSRVKGEAWSKAKRKVEEDTVQMAQDVLALYATRETLTRSPFDPTKEVSMRKFEKTFPYEPTPDQHKCFEAVENDMVWRGRPMDRLVCGDVGFGKTEVALRALFRCVANGRQAALLSPTGVLAAQHMKNVIQRMGEESGFNFNIALLRGGMGKNTKVGRVIREQISTGEVDLIVGTHALLSSGLKFQDLGLLVVDEEQRFGVKQKERLKLICSGIDVLTLSATPIPRTLQMSLSGIRDTSTIRSPPPMRKPTKTFVQEFHKNLVREAIRRELDRGGQCFYVVPRIAQLEEAEKIIKELYPEINIIMAHGRMARGLAEENVAAFAEGNYEVLLATTVIENGVDIPSVNTIIIQNAQAFGMSTLYQLRGRVGRSNVQAFAYFLHKEEAITEQSAMRLQAMADLHELGSGFDVANRDLEIRGAGSLLGTEQSGMAAKVGFDLYMRMLKKSIRKLRGLDLPKVPRTNILLPYKEGSLEIAENAGGDVTHAFEIPRTYMKDDAVRLKEEGIARLAENTQQLVEITNRWKENYGPLPVRLQSKLKTLHLHACTRILGIDLVGLIKTGKGKAADGVLRSPGLRPRHWIYISQSLPKAVPTKGLDVVFPARFTVNGEEEMEITGGKLINTKRLQIENFDDDEEEWDALDQEEVEAMKEISSSMFVKSLDEVDIDDYPRFVVKNLNKLKRGARVDALLKVLLPASKVVYMKETSDKEKAKVAADLREKREMMKQQKKEQEKNARRIGYSNGNF